MKLSASIMAHPDRAEYVGQLITDLGPLGESVPVHWDSEGKASGNADRVWRQARSAWGMFSEQADWHVLLQDDAVVCPDFLEGLALALDHVREPAIVSGYLGQGRLVPQRWAHLADRADQQGACWIRSNTLMWGVCIAMRTADIPAMIDWCDRRAAIPDDMRVSGWAKRYGRSVWYPWPSLVDHRPIASLTKHRAHDRTARRHLTDSAMKIDWSGPVVTDPMLSLNRASRSGPSIRRQAAQMKVIGQ